MFKHEMRRRGRRLAAAVYCACGCGLCGRWAVECTAVRWDGGSYQLALSEGLAESRRSAVHQHAALLSHLAVAAL